MSLDWLPQMPREIVRWPDALRAMPEVAARARALEIVDAWIDGALHHWWRPSEPRALDRKLAACMEELGGLAPDTVERDGRGEADHDTRRWCWIDCWYLSSQDEDLLLMRDPCVTPLLEEAAHDCPKRDYALSIVAHHARDSAHAMVFRKRSTYREDVGAFAPWVALARAANDEALATYLERLLSYARPGKVDREGALARISDLARCAPPIEPQIERDGDAWRGRLGKDEVLSIDAAFGDLRLQGKYVPDR